MAGHADGSIILDTDIDTDGLKARSSELKRAIKSLNTKIEALGPTFQKALSGNTSAISTFDAKATALESTISNIEAKMESLGSKRVPTEDYQWLTTEIQKTQKELSKLEEKQIKMENTGVKQNSRAWQTLQYDIDLAKRKIGEFENDQAAMRADGTAFQSGTNTAEYSQLSRALVDVKTRLAEMKSQVEKTTTSTSKLASVGKTVKSTFGKMGSAGKKAIGGISGKFKGLTRILRSMLIFRAFTGIMTAVTDGFKNLSQYSAETNGDLSALKSSLTQLKNSFAAAFAPILTVVTPALTKLIGYLSTALTYVGKFAAAMTGAKTFTQATAVQEDYAASLGETGKAAEDAQKQVAGFDELNVLNNNSSDSKSGSAGTASPSEMFEEVPIKSSITALGTRIKTAFEKGDYAGIGSVIGGGLSTAVRTAIAILRNVVTSFNWASIGGGIAAGLNSIDWVGILSDIAGWTSDILKSALDLLIGFAENLDWGKLGRDLWNSLIGIITNIDWGGIISRAFRLLGNAVGGATTLVVEFCKELWGSLKAGFENLKKTYFEPYMNDMGELTIEGFFKGIGDMLKDIGNWIVTNIWDPFINGFKNAFGIHSPSTKMAEMGDYIIQGLYDGIKNAWSNITDFFSNTWNSVKSTIENKGWFSVGSNICDGIGQGIESGWTWLKDKISSVANGLLDKAKSALGIHSPSRLFRDIVGLNIGYGIGEGIEASEGSVVKTVTGLADAIAAEANAGEYNIGGVVSTAKVDGALTDFSDKVADSFTTLLDRLKAIADGVTFAVPTVATGRVTPYSVSASTNIGSGDEKSGTNIETPLATMIQAFKTALAEGGYNGSGDTVINLTATLDGEVIYRNQERIRQQRGTQTVLNGAFAR